VSRTWPPRVRGDWRDTHRLIPATYADTSEPYLAELASDEQETALLAELTAATNGRLLAQADRSVLDLGTHELVYDLDHSQVVNAAFAYPGEGGRFHGTTRGAWYAALEVGTSLAEVAFHRGLALAEVDRWDDQLDVQDYVCDLGGDHFADLRDGGRRAAPYLDPVSYARSQELAATLLAEGASGVVWPSVRRAGGTCVVCFRPALLPPVRIGRRYRLTWSGPPEPTVEELPSPGWAAQ
jgi:hypothetical protein